MGSPPVAFRRVLDSSVRQAHFFCSEIGGDELGLVLKSVGGLQACAGPSFLDRFGGKNSSHRRGAYSRNLFPGERFGS